MGNNRRTGRFATAQDARWTAITAAYRADEATVVQRLCGQTQLPARTAARIQAQACKLIDGIRATPGSHHVLDALLTEYDLDNVEGIALMCLAEALIRVPDAATADALISDKIATADWAAHVGHSDSLLANAATWGLLLGGRLLRRGEGSDEHLPNALRRLLARSGEPIIRSAVRQAMRLVGGHFVFAADIDAAVARAGGDRQRRYSFDMLGEAARTAEDADAYFQRYLEALLRLADSEANRPWRDSNGISVKLSALHPRFDYRHGERVIAQVTERLLALARAARDADIGVTVDAEEAEVLQLSLRVFERVYRNPALVGWDGLGLAVQAYGKRALPVIDWLAALAADGARAIPVRLVKGAYWDREIKYSQQLGLADYPVFTRKRHTDVSFLACARRLLEHGQTLFPQFATHNAWSLAAIAALAPAGDFEFQRLHGMGEALYAQVVDDKGPPPRVYAPVGDHRTLLPYLIRRLLENGANTSFVNQIANPDMPAQALARDPVATVAGHAIGRHPAIPVPRHLYGEQRPNPVGVDFSDEHARARFSAQLQESEAQAVCAEPVIDCEPRTAGTAQPLRNPADTAQFVGSVRAATSKEIDAAVTAAVAGWPGWNATPVDQRAACLRRTADALEQALPRLAGLAAREAGKPLPDAVAEVREAADFCRYYALQAKSLFAPQRLPGPTGEHNSLEREGRGVFAAISPWNFPLAIFTGQVAAALVAGNTVVAKPAEQTPLIAAAAVRLLHAAGIPGSALQLLPGDGQTVGAPLVAQARLAGVLFTGSVATAQAIHRSLAARDGPIATLIAETGGLNAMIVDSSALPEQVIDDALRSAFTGAGQRCSALRVLCLQEEVADNMLAMLAGAMAELRVGDPLHLDTDVGPVIDKDARERLRTHIARMHRSARLIAETPYGNACERGHFVAPIAFEVDAIADIGGEVFGPVLHVLRYRGDQLDALIAAINATGFALTFGVHSRIDSRARALHRQIRAGNSYVNRDMIAAVPGVQPFGGYGLSGTGPKAGGPDYLRRLSVERVVCINTAAMGGDTGLLTLE